jgi:hypothetical protein
MPKFGAFMCDTFLDSSWHRSMTSRQPLFALSIRHGASDTAPPIPTGNSECLCRQESDILVAIKTFVPGSVGGPDGLRLQHLKDMIGASAGDAGRHLLALLTEFANLCITGRAPAAVQPVFCGAALCSLKKNGGILSVAVGSTLRRLIAKAACKAVSDKMTTRSLLIQVGFVVPRAADAAAHAARAFISALQSDEEFRSWTSKTLLTRSVETRCCCMSTTSCRHCMRSYICAMHHRLCWI